MTGEERDPGLVEAEELVFRALRRRLEEAGEPEAVLYLRHHVSARVAEVVSEGTRRRVRFELCQRTSDYSVQLDAVTGELRGWYFAALREDPGDAVKPAQALAEATRVAAPPPDAVLEHSGYEEQADEPVFVARWRHIVAGVPVERDFIHVLVNGSTGKAFMLQRHWHALDLNAAWR
jgi:hypothetical protein